MSVKRRQWPAGNSSKLRVNVHIPLGLVPILQAQGPQYGNEQQAIGSHVHFTQDLVVVWKEGKMDKYFLKNDQNITQK